MTDKKPNSPPKPKAKSEPHDHTLHTRPQTPPTEPAEVMGRHQNSGQKDHKGAR